MAEKIFVENLNRSDPLNFGVLSYKMIADHIFMDLAVAGAFQFVRILIDIEKPFFYIQAELKITEEPVRIADITTLTLEKEGIHVEIEDESYAPDLLRVLWGRFRRENITQRDRWNLLIPAALITIDELKQMVALSPRERILNKILDAFNRIIPEGFRVRKSIIDKIHITIIASENPIQEEWIRQAETALKNPPTSFPPEVLEKFKRTPKKIERRIVPWKTHEFQESIE